ncbi:hypothetical protein [Aquimarina longa]|uniref:hypothetical protein n=1 Tax=Aquimarina longa TaxID=1080221 RepID=UPI000784E7D2|nr:hypothetical protein [Aquimarina longa]
MKVSIVDPLNSVNIFDDQLNNNEVNQQIELLSNHRDSEIRLFMDDYENYIFSIKKKSLTKWKVDYPIELYKIHKQCYASKEECLILIKKIYQGEQIEDIAMFTDVPIRHFTLDEMLEFEQEDAMMLNGQDPNL